MARMSVRAIAVILLGAAACTSFTAPDSAPDGGTLDGATQTDGAPFDASVPSDDVGTNPVDQNVPPGALRVFVTSVGYADVTTAASADAKCVAEAAGRLPGKFVAWYPDSPNNRSAPQRLVNTNGSAVDGPWYRVDGKRVAANRAALSNASTVALEHAIDVTAAGTTNGGGVWTGTLADGGIGTLCPGTNPTTGNAASVDASWTTQSFFTAMCGTSLGLYGFQVE
jgi:hypothetical protein